MISQKIKGAGENARARFASAFARLSLFLFLSAFPLSSFASTSVSSCSSVNFYLNDSYAATPGSSASSACSYWCQYDWLSSASGVSGTLDSFSWFLDVSCG